MPSVRAAPFDPGWPRECICSFLPHGRRASTTPKGSPPATLCNEVGPGSPALRLTRSPREASASGSPTTGCPVAPAFPPASRCSLGYMPNERFTWRAPFSPLASSDLPGAPECHGNARSGEKHGGAFSAWRGARPSWRDSVVLSGERSEHQESASVVLRVKKTALAGGTTSFAIRVC